MSLSIPHQLENETLILYALRESDFDALYRVASDPAIWKQHPNKDRWKKEVFNGFFEGALKSNGAYKVVDKFTKNVLGCTRFYEYNAEEKSICIGYTFYATACWGKGINHAVKRLMLETIFPIVSTVYFHVGAENIRSQIAVSRLGAVKINEQEIAYYNEPPKLNFVYALSYNQYLSKTMVNHA